MFFANSAVALEKPLTDPALEARAHQLFQELRCVVCQGESLDASPASLAQDMRQSIRDQLMAGKSETEIKNYLVTRYGDFILMKPPLKTSTLLLWLAPLLLLAAGGAIV
ncbi:MAG: cytochrome c-type biogenesis protein CcmH, partial [Dongiaceae bacterium]